MTKPQINFKFDKIKSHLFLLHIRNIICRHFLCLSQLNAWGYLYGAGALQEKLIPTGGRTRLMSFCFLLAESEIMLSGMDQTNFGKWNNHLFTDDEKCFTYIQMISPFYWRYCFS
jgi:hypothetical protein